MECERLYGELDVEFPIKYLWPLDGDHPHLVEQLRLVKPVKEVADFFERSFAGDRKRNTGEVLAALGLAGRKVALFDFACLEQTKQEVLVERLGGMLIGWEADCFPVCQTSACAKCLFN